MGLVRRDPKLKSTLSFPCPAGVLWLVGVRRNLGGVAVSNFAMNSATGTSCFEAIALDLSPGLLSSSNLKGLGRVIGSGVGGFLGA